MKPKFSRQSFEKYTNIKFHENPFSRIRVVSCGQTKLIVAFRNFANAPKKENYVELLVIIRHQCNSN